MSAYRLRSGKFIVHEDNVELAKEHLIDVLRRHGGDFPYKDEVGYYDVIESFEGDPYTGSWKEDRCGVVYVHELGVGGVNELDWVRCIKSRKERCDKE